MQDKIQDRPVQVPIRVPVNEWRQIVDIMADKSKVEGRNVSQNEVINDLISEALAVRRKVKK